MKTNGPKISPQAAQLSIGEATSAVAGQHADGRRRGSKQVDRRGDFADRVVQTGRAIGWFDHVMAGRNEGRTHACHQGCCADRSGLGLDDGDAVRGHIGQGAWANGRSAIVSFSDKAGGRPAICGEGGGDGSGAW